MTQFIEGLDRQQSMLLPNHLDDYVDESSPVRAIDAFADILPRMLGFNAQPAATGRPGYHPGLTLRIYLYGYLNQVQSSRRLERECGRNLELIWLTGRLKPDFKTIADIRRVNGPAIHKVCQQFLALCRNMNLIDGDVLAIDGSRFKALNSKAKYYTRGKLRQKLGEIDKAIERYLGELDRADEVFEQTGRRWLQRHAGPESYARIQRALRRRGSSTMAPSTTAAPSPVARTRCAQSISALDGRNAASTHET
jgi:transposase